MNRLLTISAIVLVVLIVGPILDSVLAEVVFRLILQAIHRDSRLALAATSSGAIDAKLELILGGGLIVPLLLYQGMRLGALSSSSVPLDRSRLVALVPLSGLAYYVGIAFALLVILPIVAARLIGSDPVLSATAVNRYLRIAPVLLFLAGNVFSALSIVAGLAWSGRTRPGKGQEDGEDGGER